MARYNNCRDINRMRDYMPNRLQIDNTSRRMWKQDGWRWIVRCFYANDVSPPKRPGELAIETRHKTDWSKDVEVAAANSRSDIGSIEVTPL